MKGSRFITEAQEARLNYIHTHNDSNVSIVCRIRKPTQMELYGPNATTSTPNPLRSKAKLNTSRRSIHTRSSSNPSPLRSSSSSPNSAIQRMISPKSSLLSSYFYSVFTSSQPSDLVVACENPLQGRVIQNSFSHASDLNLFCDKRVNEGFVYKFDRVFSDTSKQERVYSECVQEMVAEMMDGLSSCVLLFGPSNSGKSYTLRGTAVGGGPDRGLLQRSVEQLFDYIGAANAKSAADFNQVPSRISLRVSMFQVDQKDKITDLLVTSSSQAPSRAQHFSPIERKVKKVDDFMQLLKDAMRTRKVINSTQCLNLKEQQNRVHSIFSLNLYCRRLEGPRKSERLSRIDFVELCASEYAASFTLNNLTGRNIEELRHFASQSFNSLSTAMIRCASSSTLQSMKEQSLLRHLLAQTLAPENKALLVCNVAPSPQSFMHSLPALKFSVQIRDAICKTRNMDSRCQYDSPEIERRDTTNESFQRATQRDPQSRHAPNRSLNDSVGSPLRAPPLNQPPPVVIPEKKSSRELTNILRDAVLNYSTFGKAKREFEIWARERELEIKRLRDTIERELERPETVDHSPLELKNCFDQLGLLLRQIEIMRGGFTDSINIPDHQPPLSERTTGFARSSPTSYKPLPPLKLNLPRAEQSGSSHKRERIGEMEQEEDEIDSPEMDESTHNVKKMIPEWTNSNSYSSFVKLKEKFEKATAKSKEFKQTLKEFVEKCHSLENEVEVKQQVIAQYEGLLEQHQQCHQKGIAELEAKNNELERALRQSQDQMTARNSEAEAQLIHLQHRVREQEEQLADVTREINGLVKEKTQLQDRLGMERKEKQEMLQSLESQRHETRESFKREEGKLFQEVSSLRGTHKEIKEELCQKSVECERAKEQSIELKFQLKEATMRAQHATQNLHRAECELNELKRKHQTQTLRLAQSEKAYDLTQLEMKQLKNELHVSQQNMLELREKIAESGNDMKMLGAKEEAKAQLLDQLQRQNETLRGVRAEMEKRLKDQELARTAVETKYAEMAKNAERNERQAKEADQEVQFLRRQLEPLKIREHENIGLLKRCAELETQLAIFENDKKTFNSLLEKLEIEKQEMQLQKQETVEDNVRLERELSFIARKQNTDIDQIDRRVEQVQQRMATVQEENIKLKEQERGLKKDLLQEREKNEALFERVADLETTVLGMRSRHNQTEQYLRMSSENFDRSNFTPGLTQIERLGTGGIERVEETEQRKRGKQRIFEEMQDMISRYREEKISRKHTLPPTFLTAELSHHSPQSQE